MNESGDIAEEQYEEGEEEGDGEEARAAEAAQEQSGAQGGHSKTWYPYITKTQFEKFISRLQAKMPDQVDRDYVRAIIRTPSMIYRFLRGIEAMRLIDRDHRPTERLRRLIVPETRKHAVGDVIKDLYPELHRQWEQNRELPDHEVTAFFRRKTGMGNDSATKMRMFFKFLMAESDMEGGEASPEGARPAPGAQMVAPPRHTTEPEPPRRGSERPAPGERADRSAASDRDRGGSADQASYQDRPFNNRGLSEPQRAYLETLQGVLNINIDGDWDEDMIRLVFDRLERLYDRVRRG
ncbi:MAG: DUF5343 domain-containing protein [Candidatus Latescibacteria bacterium]|nr:DUF5343 domain-containing protein [Candidatus Latescibacterota bacterium]